MLKLFRYISFNDILRLCRSKYSYHKIDKSDMIAVCNWRIKNLVSACVGLNKSSLGGVIISSRFDSIDELITICDLLSASMSEVSQQKKRLTTSCNISMNYVSVKERNFYIINSYYVSKEVGMNKLIGSLSKLSKALDEHKDADYSKYYTIRLLPLCDSLDELINQL